MQEKYGVVFLCEGHIVLQEKASARYMFVQKVRISLFVPYMYQYPIQEQD